MSNDNIRRLQYQIVAEKKKISNCIHALAIDAS